MEDLLRGGIEGGSMGILLLNHAFMANVLTV
jgi:hypothetical protein